MSSLSPGGKHAEDGLIAATCKEYMNPTWPYTYEGDTGDGVYKIKPAGAADAFDVYCDMTTDGGGWTTFQRRLDGSVDFYRDWADYTAGFGEASGEYWIGLDRIHALSALGVELRIDLGRLNGELAYAQYTNFSVGEAASKYLLRSAVWKHGSAGNALSKHLGLSFTTRDVDNDAHPTKNCAQVYHGAFWYNQCHWTNLNGMWMPGPTEYGHGVLWLTWTGFYESLTFTEMKVR